ncbi:MAG: hypothetical protein NTU69_08030 [Proteobacteria bacterium]|nr:hypothetical protein [Pseudomonadota bacterium]
MIFKTLFSFSCANPQNGRYSESNRSNGDMGILESLPERAIPVHALRGSYMLMNQLDSGRNYQAQTEAQALETVYCQDSAMVHWISYPMREGIMTAQQHEYSTGDGA